MSEGLPEGWTRCTVGQAGLWRSGGTPSRGEPSYFGGSTPWVKSGDLNDGIVTHSAETVTAAGIANSAARVLPAGTVSMALYGATIGRLGVLGLAAATNQACVNCQVDERGFDRWFLFYYLLSQRQEFVAAGQGGAQPNISGEIVRQWPFPLPPLAEQRRIVEMVEALLAEVNAVRDRLARGPEILKRFRQSVLAAACSGRLTADWRASRGETASAVSVLADAERIRASGSRTKEPVPIVGGELPELPATWAWASVDSLATKVADGVHKKPDYRERGVPFVTVKNLTAGPGISFENLNYISIEDHREFSKRTNPERGDILISKDGTLGVVRTVRTDAVFSIFVSVALVKPALRWMSDYLELALQAPVVQSRMVSTGTGLMHIHLRDLRAVPIPVPPREEQEEIIRRVQALMGSGEGVAKSLTTAVSASGLLPSAILAKAFRGELVPTEAELARKEGREYEPASVLLDRIKAKRETAEAVDEKPAKRRVQAKRGTKLAVAARAVRRKARG